MRPLRLLSVFSLLSLLLSGQAVAEIAVKDAWVRLLPPTVTTTAGYMALTSEQSDRLVKVTTPLAAMVEMHVSRMHEGTMQMEQVTAITLPAGEPVALAPGGLHLMIMGLKAPLQAGQRVPLLLEFEHADSMRIDAEVR